MNALEKEERSTRDREDNGDRAGRDGRSSAKVEIPNPKKFEVL